MKRFWQRLSKRERGLVVLSLLIFCLVLGRYFLLSPFLEHREWVGSELDMQPQLLEKNLRYLGRKDEIVAALDNARRELQAVEPSLISGDTPSVSASDLQQAVQALAAKEGIQIITTRVLNPDTKASFTRIPIQVEIGGQIDQLVNLIKGIESAEKRLVVDELNIRSLFRPAAAVRPPLAPVPPQQNLRATITISGFARTKSSFKNEPTAGKTKSEERKGTARTQTDN